MLTGGHRQTQLLGVLRRSTMKAVPDHADHLEPHHLAYWQPMKVVTKKSGDASVPLHGALTGRQWLYIDSSAVGVLMYPQINRGYHDLFFLFNYRYKLETYSLVDLTSEIYTHYTCVFQINGSLIELPYNNTQFTISLNGEFTQFRTSFDLIVSFSNSWRLNVTLPKMFNSSLTGFCGNYDGLPENDLKLANGNDVPSTSIDPSTAVGDSFIHPSLNKTR